MANWSVMTFRAGSRVWRSQIRRNGRIVQEIEYTGTKRAAETDARVTMEGLSKADALMAALEAMSNGTGADLGEKTRPLDD